MIYISTALYCEAQPFIQHYNLKKDMTESKFQIFRNDTIILIITKTGSINAAIGVTYLCSKHIPEPSDVFINIGICAAKKKDISLGNLFLCNKIIEQVTGRSYYPDMLFAHSFLESGIVSSPNIINDKKENVEEKAGGDNEFLIDMEAAGVYQGASIFFQPHQLIFLKVVSDYGTGEKITPEKVTGLMEGNIEKITSWVDQIHRNYLVNPVSFLPEEEECISKVVTNLQCSVSMEYQLRQILRYHKLIHGSLCDRINQYMDNSDMPCKTKTEGKIYFEELKSKLI
ncbi:5'-methylthioadenosine/S-adenosylhomocysteine nucleosidase family protein [Anaerocolumna sp.]|uniref:5'-methylthioadenosine/S-adenosylhomocysteine nucleosidase family protein n=1 Tax=Anaerocolumna sp. TaxID=2041569 RepID=UPI0028A91AD7|nr:hypothetical protein [Anaerocolumna sp.]